MKEHLVVLGHHGTMSTRHLVGESSGAAMLSLFWGWNEPGFPLCK